MICNCPDWATQIEKVNAPIMLSYARNPDTYKYEGKPFAYCPWCGDALQPDEKENVPSVP